MTSSWRCGTMGAEHPSYFSRQRHRPMTVSGGSSDRPMLNWIFENAYHLIQSYVEEDPTAFYTYEELKKGVETLRQFCSLRSESISKQIENGETTEDMGYVDASSITLSDMGSMDSEMGGFGKNMPSMPEGFDSSDLPEDIDVSKLSESSDTSNLPEDFAGEFSGQPFGGQEDTESSDENETENSDTDNSNTDNQNTDNPRADFSFDRKRTGMTGSDFSGWIWIAVSAAILVVGLIVAKKYKS